MEEDKEKQNEANSEEKSEEEKAKETSEETSEETNEVSEEGNKEKTNENSKESSSGSNPDSNKSVDFKKMSSSLKKNPWKTATFGLIALFLILLLIGSFSDSSFTGQATGSSVIFDSENEEIISQEEAGEKVEDLFESQGAEDVEITGTSEEKGMYRVDVSVQGQETPIHVTKDGENLVEGLMSFEEVEQQQAAQDQQEQTTNEQESSEYSEEEIEKLSEFNDCLSDNEVVIYGQETCPHCSELVESLGGYEAVENVYVECTENTQKCSEEMIGSGVPEIQIEGEMHEGSRSIEALADATGCKAPELE
ncbi:MAG: hypothetical protein ACOC1P_05265 [Minisyncoccales bacterium]